MDEPEELEYKLQQAKRLASVTTDLTTVQRLRAFADELNQKLQRVISRRQLRARIRARAHGLWEEHGKPPGRDQEFWLQAERELIERGNGNWPK